MRELWFGTLGRLSAQSGDCAEEVRIFRELPLPELRRKESVGIEGLQVKSPTAPCGTRDRGSVKTRLSALQPRDLARAVTEPRSRGTATVKERLVTLQRGR